MSIAVIEPPKISGITERELVVRDAHASDWLSIWPIWNAVVACGETHPYARNSTQEDAFALWFKPARSAVYIAEQSGRVVAAMQTKPMRYGNGDHIANFDLMVSPEHRCRGVGRALSMHVIDATRRTGYNAMEAFAVVESNVAAVRLWQSLGFQIVATVPNAFRHPTRGTVAVYHMHMQL
ncbi:MULTISPECIES: GNAT family N-acetyltransferase [unclassified Lysobacter]|uniref:GNAT family N-acetyltransferase n=1 Tax=unclassified Lysobacter TaxID=2635362 RepID=UPI001BE9144D|nr:MULTISPECIES: GNAT family N-acetyltransferase [unclassified Lysobacter]MBT2748705.1 GNAT family N-acetyltransferase [Lysobacter sp. ISL-42]MBT2751640.1 GNAT family N-acetyltransferase [Lysobacter sp. ISL-50]MBT2775834.1 GNAT family N-acetyltransferase [Lysobacter sp. ISL-54]MBT2782201.1 GNAT family N-acetyltransferase [Lysobacter sp. ISL-52]